MSANTQNRFLSDDGNKVKQLADNVSRTIDGPNEKI